MRVYLAASYARKDEIARYVQECQQRSIDVTSTWTDEPHAPGTQLDQVDEKTLQELARRDYTEIIKADMLILFTKQPNEPYVRAAHHAEFGIALALGKRLVVVGYRETIFQYLPFVRVFETWQECREAICG